MKSIIYVVLIILFVVTLFDGCGGQAKTDTQAAAPKADDTKATEERKDSTVGKEVQITLCRPHAPEVEDNFWLNKVEEFNKANAGHIKLSMEVITRGNSYAYEDKINAAVASHSLPDILSLDGPNVANYAASKIIAPLDEYFTKDDLSDFVPSIIQQGTYNSKFYAVGNAESSVVLFYNKNIMQENGIEPPTSIDKAWTWNDWYNVMNKCAKNGVMGTNMINDKGEWMTYAFEQLWVSNGTDLLNKEGTQAEGFVNGPKGVEAAEFLSKLAKEKLFNIDPTPMEFEQGKAATKLGGPWNIPGFEYYPNLEWGITYFPKSPNGTSTAPSGSWTFAVSAGSKNPKEAATVIKFLTNKDNAAAFTKISGNPATRKSAYDILTEYNNLPLKIIKEQVTTVSHTRPVTPAYPVLTQKFAEALTNIMMGADIKKSLDNAAKTYDDEYTKNFANK